MISAPSPRIDVDPADIVDLPAALVQARLQVAALKTQQDVMAMQGRELARLMEPHKGNFVDTYA